MSSTPTEPTPMNGPATIIAGPGKGYRIKFALFAILMVGMGGWFGYDGFIEWPHMNERLRALKGERDEAVRRLDSKRSAELLEQINALNHGQERTGSELRLQKILSFTLPPFGILLLVRSLRNSSGVYRLEGNVLHVPRHPPVPLENVTEIDRRLWDRKGIALISYDLGDGQQGTLRLDDYFHDRPPTDEIFKRIEQFVAAENSAAPPEK